MTEQGRVLPYEAALHAAIDQYLATGAIDMEALADGLAVGRATLYRVVGNRDLLLGDVIWTLGSRSLEQAVAAVGEQGLRGVDAMLEISRRMGEDVLRAQPLQWLLERDPSTAMRVLFTPAGRVHERFVAAWEELFREAEARGELQLPFDPRTFAYVYVRVGESMLYGDLLAGIEPDLYLAANVRRALFQASPIDLPRR